MSLFTTIETDIEGFNKVAESDVLAIIAKVNSGVQLAISEFQAFTKWIDANIGTINSDFSEFNSTAQQVLAVAQTGNVGNANVQKAISAANATLAVAQTTMNALNAYAANNNSGTTDVQGAIAAYQAIKNATAVTQNLAAATAAVVQANPSATQTVSPPTPAED